MVCTIENVSCRISDIDSLRSFLSNQVCTCIPIRSCGVTLYIVIDHISQGAAEVQNPRKLFPRTCFAGVTIVIVILTGVNILYAAIIPEDQLFKLGSIDVLAVFMKLTIGHLMTNQAHLVTFYSIIKAISALEGLSSSHPLQATARMKTRNC